MPARLGRKFYRRDSITLAQALLGQRLVRVVDGQRVSGRIIETEAYLGIEDAAAHTYKGRRTARVASMWMEGGTAYVYFTYGAHFCMNVVAGVAGDPVAVLLRALEPEENLDFMRRRRKHPPRDTALCSGPGKLCQALAIDRSLDGADLTTSPALFIERTRSGPLAAPQVVSCKRIGIAYAGEWAHKPLRFYLSGNPHVSKR